MSNCPKCGTAIQGNELNCPKCGVFLNKSLNNNVASNVQSGMKLPMTAEAKVQLSNAGATKSVLGSNVNQSNMVMPEIKNVTNQVNNDSSVNSNNTTGVNINKSVVPNNGSGSSAGQMPVKQLSSGSSNNGVQKLKDVDKILDNTTVLNVNNKKKAKKKSSSKSLFIIVALLFVVLLFGGKILWDMNLKKKEVVVPNNSNLQEESYQFVNSNGFKFKMDKTWLLSEDGDDILVYNNNESLVIYFKKETANFSLLNEADIKSAFDKQSNVSNLEVNNIELGVRKAFLAKLDYSKEEETSKVEYYYLDGGSSLVVGVYVRYSSDDVYSENKDKVAKMLEELSYADESIKTFNMKSKYSEIFSTGRSIFY